MIFPNNYYFAGPKAVIYKVELDHQAVGMTIFDGGSGNFFYQFPSQSGLTEIGVEYKKQSDDQWQSVPLVLQSSIEYITSPNYEHYITPVEDTADIYVSTSYAYGQRIYPLYVVIRNLTPSTVYEIRSYSVLDGVKINFNVCSFQTAALGDITYECVEVVNKDDLPESSVENLRYALSASCTILNDIGAFTKKNSSSDSLNSSSGGSFTATLVESLVSGGGADSRMYFTRGNSTIGSCIHEMAHNLMEKVYPDLEDPTDKIVKFMEFATHSEGGFWRWLGGHNYPVISSASYDIVGNYMVAAACYLTRELL